jgi:hypothetical protein
MQIEAAGTDEERISSDKRATQPGGQQEVHVLARRATKGETERGARARLHVLPAARILGSRRDARLAL